MQPDFAHRPAARRHSFELMRDDVLEATLAWYQDAADRRGLGWYLERPGRARAPRRLSVEHAIDDLAGDRLRSTADWLEDADSLAMLTTDRALRQAEQLLRGELTPRTRRLDSFRAGRYEVLVTAADAVALAIAFPTAGLSQSGAVTVLEGCFDESSMQAALDRLAQLGVTVVGVVRKGEATTR